MRLDFLDYNVGSASQTADQHQTTFPKKFKQAHVRPLLKKIQACIQLEFHFQNLRKDGSQSAANSYKNNHLSNSLQSAYKKHHSTVSALLKVHNNIIISLDKGEVTALTLLDLSAAFGTIDHATLTDRLSDWYGISGQAHIWFSSYLQNRHQSVKIKNTLEFHRALCWDQCLLLYILHHSALLYLVLTLTTIFKPVILQFTCLYQFQTLRNLLRSCNSV